MNDTSNTITTGSCDWGTVPSTGTALPSVITVPTFQFPPIVYPYPLPFEPCCEEDDEDDDEMMMLCPSDFVKKIIKNNNATIVFWADDTKTVVRWSGDGEDSEYTAFTAAFAIKCFGSNSHLKRVIKDKIEYHGKPEKKEKVSVEQTEFVLGDWVTIKHMEYLTGGFPRKIVAINRDDNTYKVEGVSETWWRGEALKLAKHEGEDNVG